MKREEGEEEMSDGGERGERSRRKVREERCRFSKDGNQNISHAHTSHRITHTSHASMSHHIAYTSTHITRTHAPQHECLRGAARPGRRRVAAVHGVNTMLAADRFTITTTLTLAITVTTTNTTTAAAVVR